MTAALRIARAKTRLLSPVAIQPERLAAWEAEFAQLDGDSIAQRRVRPDEWLLIRHLTLRTRWRIDEAGLDVSHAWSSALEQAIDEAVAQSLSRQDGNCVRYRHRREAVADMIYRSALRDDSRQWAWQRMGLIPRTELHSDEALRHALREIERQPELAWPVLIQLLEAEPETAAFTAALRALQGSLLPALLQLSPRSRGYATLGAAPAGSPPAPAAAALAQAEAAAASAPVWPATARAVVEWARSRPLLAQRHRAALAPLLAALTWPAPGRSPQALKQGLGWAMDALLTVTPAVPQRAAPPSAGAVARTELQATAPAPASPAAPSTPVAALPELPEAEPGLATAWGGALFWLTRLGAAWAALNPAPELAWLLHETARALGVPPDDPALAAFCGGELPVGTPPAEVPAQAQALVASWEAWLAQAAPELPAPRAAAVCQRRGRLVIEPGWITLHLPLGSVDTAVRRLALDLDPGWLPWLGCVVKVVYDES